MPEPQFKNTPATLDTSTDSDMFLLALQIKEISRPFLAEQQNSCRHSSSWCSREISNVPDDMWICENGKAFANFSQTIRKHASKSKKPALRLVSIVSEKQLWLHIDSLMICILNTYLRTDRRLRLRWRNTQTETCQNILSKIEGKWLKTLILILKALRYAFKV